MTKLISNMKINLSNRISSVGYISKKMFLAWVRLNVWALQVPKAPYMYLGTRLLRLWNINGSTFVVNYTKECTRIVQAYVSGNPVFITNIPISLVGGLPRIIPGALRLLLRGGDPDTTRAILSVFSVYRVINIPGKVKLQSITDPFSGLSTKLSDYEVRIGSGELFGFRNLKLQPISLLHLGTAGPNSSVSMLGIWKDLLAWKDSPLRQDLLNYCSLAPGGLEFLSLIAKELNYLTTGVYTGSKSLILGRLSEKLEAAGKVRIFAITDVITQSVFRPLSDGIFKILDSLPMDGTFDQNRPVEHIRHLVSNDLMLEKDATFYSYDLSSATDRLPIDIQRQVLTRLIGDQMSNSWVNILTKRDWYYKGKPLRYSVGQPMGALSSWAMLALTHHTLVRIAANRVGIHNFVDYALLGDDIVIANTSVSFSYHHLMTEVLGVEINLSKSLVSKHSFEFAKRLITFKGEVSPIGAKNVLVGLKSLKGIPSILLDLVNKGVRLSEDSVNNLYKSIPTVRKGQMERLSWLVKGPFGFIPTEDGLSTNLKLSNSLSAVCMDRFLSSIDEARFRQSLCLWERNLRVTNDIICKFLALEKIPGFDLCIKDSPLYLAILDHYWSHYGLVISKKPVRRFIFDGPLVFTDYYRESWKFEMMSYIKTKIRDDRDETVSPLDPFADDKIILPLSHSLKAENFWLLVKEIEEEKTSILGFRGLV